VIHAHKLNLGHAESEQTIRPDVMDVICKALKSNGKPAGYTYFHIYTKTLPTKAEISYMRLFGYCVEYMKCVTDYRITWGGYE
jgi:hypothetical protein